MEEEEARLLSAEFSSSRTLESEHHFELDGDDGVDVARLALQVPPLSPTPLSLAAAAAAAAAATTAAETQFTPMLCRRRTSCPPLGSGALSSLWASSVSSFARPLSRWWRFGDY